MQNEWTVVCMPCGEPVSGFECVKNLPKFGIWKGADPSGKLAVILNRFKRLEIIAVYRNGFLVKLQDNLAQTVGFKGIEHKNYV